MFHRPRRSLRLHRIIPRKSRHAYFLNVQLFGFLSLFSHLLLTIAPFFCGIVRLPQLTIGRRYVLRVL